MSTSANFVGSVPTFYDQGLGPVLFHHYADDISARAAAHGPESTLELAAGTGIVTQALRRALSAGAAIQPTDARGGAEQAPRRRRRQLPAGERAGSAV